MERFISGEQDLMRENLFRREVLTAQHDNIFGDPVFYQPLSLRFLVLSALTILVVVLGFAASAHIKQTENVRGFIFAANGEVKVYSTRSGVIQQLHVSNGDLVEQGQTLNSTTFTQLQSCWKPGQLKSITIFQQMPEYSK